MPHTYDDYRERVETNNLRAGLKEPSLSKTMKAYEMAWEFHRRAKNRRNGEPFISHPVAVHEILVDCGVHDGVTLRIALLHDVIEDTHATMEDLEETGPQTYRSVDRLSRSPVPDDVKKSEWREKYLEDLIAHGSLRDILVKIADRIHNLETIDELKPHQRLRSAREAEKYLLPIAFKLNMKLAERLEKEIKRVLSDKALVKIKRDSAKTK